MNDKIIKDLLNDCYLETRPSEEQLRSLPEYMLVQFIRWNQQIKDIQKKVRWNLMSEDKLIEELVFKIASLEEGDNSFLAKTKTFQSSINYNNGIHTRKSALISLLEKF